MEVGWFEIISIIMSFQLLIFSFFLFFKKKNRISNLLLGIFLFSQALGIFNVLYFHQFQFFFNRAPHLLLVGFPFCFLWGPAFYLYVSSLIHPGFKIQRKYLLHFIPFTLMVIYLFFAFYTYNAATKFVIISSSSFIINFYNNYINLGIIVQITIYNIIALVILYKYRERLKTNFTSIARIGYSWLTFVIIGYTVSHFISTSINLISFSNEDLYYSMRMVVFITFFIYFNIIFFRGWYQPEIFTGISETDSIKEDTEEPETQAESGARYKYSRLTKAEAEACIKKLDEFIKTNKPYFDPELTLNQLAESLTIQPRILSQVINEYFNQNFYDYINRLRIEESKKLLLDPLSRMNISEVLYKTGFNSKATFNRVFKKETGLSPSGYKKKFLQSEVMS